MDEQDVNNMQYQLGNAQLNTAQIQNQQYASSMNDENSSTIKHQLDLSEELEKLDNLLRGKIQKRINGDMMWMDAPNNDNILLSEAGINLVLNTIQWYLNKNTLLSNYDVDTINSKMKDFGDALADALFMNYQKYFLYPTAEECNQKLIQRLLLKQKDQIDTYELRGQIVDEKQKKKIWKDLVQEIDPTTERKKIREQIIKDKLKMYDLMMRVIQDTVHSTYNRAFAGQERKTLRQHIHVTENMSPNINQKQNSRGMFGSYKER